MKISVVIADGVKQVMMTPESDHEREALRWIAPSDSVEIATAKWGTFDDEAKHYAYNAAMCQAGYLRRFATENSLMFVLKPKDKK